MLSRLQTLQAEQMVHLGKRDARRHGHEHSMAALIHSLWHREAMLVQGLHEGVFLQRSQAREVQPAASASSRQVSDLAEQKAAVRAVTDLNEVRCLR